MQGCSSVSKLPTTFGLMKSVCNLNIDHDTEWQAVGLGQFNALKALVAAGCTDEVVTLLYSLGTFRNLDYLSKFWFLGSVSMTKLPETMGLLTNLTYLELQLCLRLQELPNSIGQLKLLTGITILTCSSLKTLPDCLGAWTSLQALYILECRSFTTLPTSIGLLSSLRQLRIESCSELQGLPDSIRQLNALEFLTVMDCGSLEGLGALRALQGLRIWGCTSITELPGSCLLVSDSHTWDPDWLYGLGGLIPDRRGLNKLRLVEATDCGFLRFVQEVTESGRLILQRVYNSPCRKWSGLIHLNIHVATEWQAVGINGQLNNLKVLRVTECTDEAITMHDDFGTLRNLNQLSKFWFYKCSSMTKLPKTMGLMRNLLHLHLYDCAKVQELPHAIGELKVLTRLSLRKCSSLEAVPDGLGALPSLQSLWIVQCTSITKIPTSMGELSSLRKLRIEECGELEPLPDSLRHLNALVDFAILDCGSLEGMGALRVLQGLRMWGCMSITELPGSCLMVLDSEFHDPDHPWDLKKFTPVKVVLKELRVVEATDCGLFRFVQEDTESGRLILQLVHNLPCFKSTNV